MTTRGQPNREVPDELRSKLESSYVFAGRIMVRKVMETRRVRAVVTPLMVSALRFGLGSNASTRIALGQ